MNPSDFTTALFGAQPAGLLHTWSLADKRSYYHRSPYGTDIHAGQSDVFVGVGLARKDHGRSRRTPSHEVIGIAGCWLDVDDEKVPSANDAVRLVEMPTILVSSGHGLHAWWLFEEPWMFADKTEQQDAANMACQWQKLHRAQHPGLDSTYDLARLMRLPSTLNAKDPANPIPVTVLSSDGPRYPRARLRARAHEAGPVHIELGAERAAGPLGGRLGRAQPLRAGGTLNADVLDGLLEVPEFAALWNHQRDKHWSLSEYDLALCNLMASEWDDQQLCDLVAAHRAHYGETRKVQRVRYLERTIHKARESAERENLMQRIREQADERRAA